LFQNNLSVDVREKTHTNFVLIFDVRQRTKNKIPKYIKNYRRVFFEYITQVLS
jgi:hypothetical protein